METTTTANFAILAFPAPSSFDTLTLLQHTSQGKLVFHETWNVIFIKSLKTEQIGMEEINKEKKKMKGA